MPSRTPRSIAFAVGSEGGRWLRQPTGLGRWIVVTVGAYHVSEQRCQHLVKPSISFSDRWDHRLGSTGSCQPVAITGTREQIIYFYEDRPLMLYVPSQGPSRNRPPGRIWRSPMLSSQDDHQTARYRPWVVSRQELSPTVEILGERVDFEYGTVSLVFWYCMVLFQNYYLLLESSWIQIPKVPRRTDCAVISKSNRNDVTQPSMSPCGEFFAINYIAPQNRRLGWRFLEMIFISGSAQKSRTGSTGFASLLDNENDGIADLSGASEPQNVSMSIVIIPTELNVFVENLRGSKMARMIAIRAWMRRKGSTTVHGRYECLDKHGPTGSSYPRCKKPTNTADTCNGRPLYVLLNQAAGAVVSKITKKLCINATFSS